MRTPERDAVWGAGYRAGVEAGFKLATATVRLQLRRQREALGSEPYHAPELLLDADGPRWIDGDGGNGKAR